MIIPAHLLLEVLGENKMVANEITHWDEPEMFRPQPKPSSIRSVRL